jgi:hypothetical protein
MAEKSFRAKAKKWSAENDLHGPAAFLRYVMFRFVENLNRESNDFVLKGANLLWVYITKVCRGSDDISYAIQAYKGVSQNGKSGASVTLSNETNEGAKNQFDLDIIYELETDTAKVESPIDVEVSILSASIENIIVDKFSASVRFGSGNTRMKDYDDLWRLSQSNFDIDSKFLKT